ncbi:Protein CBG24370 [Caenorhabditis briggsae]|uniref:Protein CBG22320 n=1 Tax=Caenorhabditis briggsae TaxID=6238 RepID=G2J729_CAEBR|nr:Protein CBG22320 [Caenorhabditis briggsae]XP_002648240.1 Protein CBG24370 [Caenorhabditis briggsae]CAP20993.1 Protein CBG24370 [Caenorhabditis briggsae]CAP38945.1 Protein CBG22320 [Caenorhabditis briggsae]
MQGMLIGSRKDLLTMSLTPPEVVPTTRKLQSALVKIMMLLEGYLLLQLKWEDMYLTQLKESKKKKKHYSTTQPKLDR